MNSGSRKHGKQDTKGQVVNCRAENASELSYDPASQVQQILHKLGASGPTINQATYTYNGVGNRTSLTDRRGSQAFGYDNLDRLTSASHPLLGTPQSFAYDAVGNRTTAGNVVNAGNQLTADATHSYQYDDNGNLTRKTLLATGNYTSYTYDAENRLTKVEDFVAGNPTAAFTSTYRYDGLGRRIEKVANGQTKRYIYDGEDILLEYDGSNVLQASYTHGPGIDEPIAVTKGGSTFFYHQDGLGSVTDLTDSAGVTAKSYAYDAYGNILESPGTVEQAYTYTGREFDPESGLYYYRARYYDPASGRFIRKDPIGLLAGPNLYGYVEANPLRWIDPYGAINLQVPGTSGETSLHANPGPSVTPPGTRAEHLPPHVHVGSNDGPRIRTDTFEPLTEEDARRLSTKQKKFCGQLSEDLKKLVRERQSNVFRFGRIMAVMPLGLDSVTTTCKQDPMFCAEIMPEIFERRTESSCPLGDCR